jgi:hypothetical protein
MPSPDTPYGSWNAAELFKAWLPVPSAAARAAFVQPILPGWTFNINSHNSSAPQTEANVLARHSYGRQIGRLSDAVRTLIVEAFGEAPAQPAFADFLRMVDEIDEVKQETAKDRLEQIAADVALLQATRPDEYAALRRQLLAALDAADR